MRREPLLFSHANGFPAACYRKFFSYLEPDFRIGSINCIGHDPDYPVTDGWPHLVAQLIDRLSAHCRRPVVGVGHSLGGYPLTSKRGLRSCSCAAARSAVRAEGC